MNTRPSFPRPARGSTEFWILIGAASGFGLAVLALLIGGIARGALALAEPTPVFIRLALPSATPVPPTPTPTPEVSPTPTAEVVEGAGSGLRLGILVEVVGTGGGGLRLRQSPSLAAEILSLGLENEVLRVDDGPVDADGHVWWFLVNPFAADKQGWGVAEFLRPLD